METSILSESASRFLADGILELAEKIAEEKIRMQCKKWLMQKEVFKEYRCDHKTLMLWEAKGLKRRKQGNRWFYDREEIDELLEAMKE